MNTNVNQTDQHFYFRWVRITFAGWLFGFVLIIIGSIIGDLLDAGGSQFIVGIAMGAGVGYTQGRALNRWMVSKWQWMWASTIGLAVPFVVTDLVYVLWGEFSFTLPILLLTVAFGSLIAGFLQHRILASKFDNTLWWIPACVLGWCLAGGGMGFVIDATNDITGRWLGFFINLVIILSGGVILGLVTGGPLLWIMQKRRFLR